MSVIRYIKRNKGPEGVTRRLLCDAFGVNGITACREGKLVRGRVLFWVSSMFGSNRQEKGGAE